MAQEVEYLIRIIGEGEASESQQPSGLNTESRPLPANKGGISMKQLKVGAGAAIIGRSAFNFATSNVAEFTGSSRRQAEINNTLRFAGHAAHIAISPVTGLAALGVDIATSEISRRREIMWKEKELEERRARLGISTNNRSRER